MSRFAAAVGAASIYLTDNQGPVHPLTVDEAHELSRSLRQAAYQADGVTPAPLLEPERRRLSNQARNVLDATSDPVLLRRALAHFADAVLGREEAPLAVETEASPKPMPRVQRRLLWLRAVAGGAV
jgi:hypothetical protein